MIINVTRLWKWLNNGKQLWFLRYKFENPKLPALNPNVAVIFEVKAETEMQARLEIARRTQNNAWLHADYTLCVLQRIIWVRRRCIFKLQGDN